MKSTSWRLTLAQILLGSALLLALFAVRGVQAGNQRVPVVSDWSHRHLLYSPPHSVSEQLRASVHSRYIQQWIRKNHRDPQPPKGNRRQIRTPLTRDWNVYLGNPATVGAGMYPAKFQFLGGDSCGNAAQPDFVAYNTNLAGSITPVNAFVSGNFSVLPAIGSTITITHGGTNLVLTTTANTNSGHNYGRGGSISTSATNLANAINRAGNGSSVGVSASSFTLGGAALVIVTASASGPTGNSITVSSSGNSNFAWAIGHLVDGATGAPTIAAFDNLYSGCSGTLPSSYWAYNTGTDAITPSSVALSRNGDQLAFVQDDDTGVASLVLLKWAADGSTVDSPTDLTGADTVTPANYRTCTAPCMTAIAFNGAASSFTSSPFVDYDHDTIYVGDDNGSLHQFTGVFYSTPAETVASGANIWPAPLSPGNILTGPLYDDMLSSPQVFVADNAGFLYRVDATIGGGSGGVVTSGQLAASGFGIDDTPILDVTGTAGAEGGTQGLLYVFVRQDNGTYNGPAVYDIAAQFTPGDLGLEVSVSTDGTPPSGEFFSGDFDANYWNTGVGNLYACSTNGDAAAMWQIAVNGNTQMIGTPVVGPSLTSTNVQCSPVTEFENGPTDRIFVSVTGSAISGGNIRCPSSTNGCIMSFDVSDPTTWSTTTGTSATPLLAQGGTSGVVVDNTDTGGSEVYFTPLGTGNCTTAANPGIGGCAVQATQAGLN